MNTESTQTPESLGSPLCSELPAHHREALESLYQSAGVGDTLAHKFAFWNREGPGTFISHNPTDEQTVAIHEIAWLADRFPSDFQFL